MIVPDHRGEHPAEEIEVSVAFGGEDPTALASVDLKWLGVVRGQEARKHVLVAV